MLDLNRHRLRFGRLFDKSDSQRWTFFVKIESLKTVSMPCFRYDVQRIDYSSSVDGLEDWALAYSGEAADTWVVCLHGHGSSGDQLYTRPDIRDAWLSRIVRLGLSVVTPNLRGNSWMGPAAALDLHELLEYLNCDFGARRYIFLSGSMGGTANLIYAVLYPADVQGIISLGAATDIGSYAKWCAKGDKPIHTEISAAICCSYGGSPEEIPRIYKAHSALTNAATLAMPIYLVHGENDETMPVEQARELYMRLEGQDTLTYREIPDGNHDSPLRHIYALDVILQRVLRDNTTGTNQQ